MSDSGNSSNIVHHHTIIVAEVGRHREEITCDALREFLSALVVHIKMQALFEPIAIDGKYGFTGIVGIVTSHIAFHYYDNDHSLHLDVYSCKNYDLISLLRFVDEFWRIRAADIVFFERDEGPRITQYKYSAGTMMPLTPA